MPIFKKWFGSPDVTQLKANKDVGGLINALNYKPDAEVRREAAKSLGELRARLASDALIKALQEDLDGSVRRAAAAAIGRITAPRCLLPLYYGAA